MLVSVGSTDETCTPVPRTSFANRIGASQDRMLGAAIRRQTGAREFACKRSDVDDVPAPRGGASSASLVPVDHARTSISMMRLVTVSSSSTIGPGMTCIVDQYVDRAEFTFDGVEEVEERGRVGDVETNVRMPKSYAPPARVASSVSPIATVAPRLTSRFAVANPMPGRRAGDDHYLTVRKACSCREGLQNLGGWDCSDVKLR